MRTSPRLRPIIKSRSDAMLVVDTDAGSQTYGKIVGRVDLPNIGDELHHFGWNACSALGAPDGGGPGGIFVLDHFDFNVLGRWEVDRGPQELAYDFWWHLGHDILISSEWGTPNKIENGLDPEHLLPSGYGHQLHIWDLRRRKHQQTIDLGKEQQMVLELRPSHDPTRTFGFAGVVVSLKDLSASVWLWKRDNGRWGATKVIEIPAEPADPDLLSPLLKGFKAVPPLVTDINLSLDDKWLYVSCWGTGELRRYDVSTPDSPKLTSAVQLGGNRASSATSKRAKRRPQRRPANGGN
jgi:methanethiol oxidase